MKALKGIRVLDLSQVMAGPYCSMLLADMGADVIKIEPPLRGENTRRMGPPFVNGESGAFLSVNRNKRGIAINLKEEEGVKLFHRLAKTADVIVENYRPGVVKRLGIDYDTIRLLNPRIIYCSISGFGQTGPYSNRGGYDLIAQGMSGIMSVTGEKGGNPVKCGLPITDLGAGMFACYGILTSLMARERTGEGQYVDTSLFEAGLAMSVWESTEYWYSGEIPQPTGSAHRLSSPYQAFQAKDGYFTIGADTEHHWPLFCSLIGLSQLVTDERFAENYARMKHLPELVQLVEEKTTAHPRSYWLEQFEKAGIPAGPINTFQEALNDPHTLAREMVHTLEHPVAGSIKALGIPVKLSRTPGEIVRTAPMLGEHTLEIMQELDFSTEEMELLTQKKII
ncbi:CaiB/BaiF CoA transferase family protein [Brevibacillus sp. NRS-1366]|uniref:CaiB/BaiF CoA transferase family protein n=1 Tax=Brevibacillus sp. NRS-1366 TaxID=3233899 RepID=UPI003D1C5FCB